MNTGKQRAVEVIPDKFWITYDLKGNKTGTLRPAADDNEFLIQYFVDGTKLAHDRSEMDVLFDFEKKQETSTWYQEYVLGYPIPELEPFKEKEKDNLPCFTKSEQSKIYYAAGYYGINFSNGGWMDAFCPKLSTLRKYEYIGPFKTAVDAQIAVKRKLNTKEQ